MSGRWCRGGGRLPYISARPYGRHFFSLISEICLLSQGPLIRNLLGALADLMRFSRVNRAEAMTQFAGALANGRSLRAVTDLV